MSITLLIMAAGLGSRYGGNKQVDTIGPNNEILMEYSIFDAVEAGFDKVVFVIRKSMDAMFREKIGNKIAERVTVEYAYQEDDTLPLGFTSPAQRTKPYGTVHAVYCAKDVITGPFAVINADDYYGKSAFKIVRKALETLPEQGRASMVAYYLRNTVSENGSVTRGICTRKPDGTLEKVTETYKIMPCPDGTIRDFSRSQSGVTLNTDSLVSMNFWVFSPWIFTKLGQAMDRFIKQMAKDDLTTEYPLPVMIDEIMQANEITVDVLETDSVWFGVTYPQDKPFVRDELRKLHDLGAYPMQL